MEKHVGERLFSVYVTSFALLCCRGRQGVGLTLTQLKGMAAT